MASPEEPGSGAAADPIDGVTGGLPGDVLTQPMSRRAFLVRAAEVGIVASALGPLVAACGEQARLTLTPRPVSSLQITPVPSFTAVRPVIDPLPTTATYGDMIDAGGLAADLPGNLQVVLEDIAAETSIPVSKVAVAGRRQATLTVATDDASLPSQAYRLTIAPTTGGAAVTIRSSDDAGATNALVSLGRLLVAHDSTFWLRAAEVQDAPGFARRGFILDPWVMAANGVTGESRQALLDRIKLGARYKLNFVDLPRDPWPALTDFCTQRHIEIMVPIGFAARLLTTPRDELKWLLGVFFDKGARSFSLNCDDLAITDGDGQAKSHAEVFVDLYDYVRSRDSNVRVSTVLPPYGGIPGQRLVGARAGEGEKYLARMRELLPSDVRVFWTGDGGVFSPRITAAGAKAYGDAIGHEMAIWDNDATRFASGRYPLSGRDPDVGSVAPTYMGNLAGEWGWVESNGRFAMLTSLMYTWNPAAYEPFAARDAAERILSA